jgi:hypothetical protein
VNLFARHIHSRSVYPGGKIASNGPGNPLLEIGVDRRVFQGPIASMKSGCRHDWIGCLGRLPTPPGIVCRYQRKDGNQKSQLFDLKQEN